MFDLKIKMGEREKIRRIRFQEVEKKTIETESLQFSFREEKTFFHSDDFIFDEISGRDQHEQLLRGGRGRLHQRQRAQLGHRRPGRDPFRQRNLQRRD